MPARLLSALLASAVVLLVAASAAGAAVRYAAPGGTGASPCAQADPCSFFTAASTGAPIKGQAAEGDEVVLLPGVYAGTGDLGPNESIVLVAGLTVRGSGSRRVRIESAATIR